MALFKDDRMNAARRMTRFAIGFLLLPLAVHSQVSRQDQTSAKPLRHEVRVALKLIQVYVTDKAGRPVRDLTRDDFVVTDNGRPVTITDFERHVLDAPGLEPPSVAEPMAEDVAPPAVPTPDSIRRRFVIFFDFAWNSPRGVAAGIRAALDFLDTEIAPADEVALVSYSAIKGLRIHESLTTDKAKVRKALAGLTAKEISGRAEEIEQAYWLLAEAGAEKELHENWEYRRRESARQAGDYFRALTRLAQALRLFDGYKNILFFSSGVPSSLVKMTRTVGTDAYLGSHGVARGSQFLVGNSELRPLQEAMLKDFRASNCSFYAFDTRSSAKPADLFMSDEIQSQTRIMVERNIFRDDKTLGMDSLRRMARATGGKYYANILRYDQNLEEVKAITGTYYVLGYPMPQIEDGKFHDVGVEVKRKGCQVRTQPGYFNPKPFREYSDLEKSLHLFDLALNPPSESASAKPLGLSVLCFEEDGASRVQALARISGDLWGDFEGSGAEIVAVFFDADDGLASLQRGVITPADYAGRDILFSASALTKAGAVACRIIIRDLDTGRSEVVSSSAHAGARSGQGLALFSPLLLVRGGGLDRLEGVVKGGAAVPAWHDVYGFDASAYTPIIGGEPAVSGKVLAVVPFAENGTSPAEVAFRINLVDSSTGQDLPVSFELRERAARAGLQIQSLEIFLDGIPPGNYLLYIRGVDKATGSLASVYTALAVSQPVSLAR